MQPHPLANAFPCLDGKEYQELEASIREQGLLHPVVLLDGKILDGRARLQACEKIGADYQTVPYEGADPAAYVVERNLHRRPLNESQRGLIAARLVQITSAGNAGIPALSQLQAAQLLDVSRDTVTLAKLVLSCASPQNLAHIESGKLRLGVIARALRGERRGRSKKSDASSKGKNPERIQRQKENAALWGGLRAALDGLSSLPLASDVARIARHQDKSGFVDQRLSRVRGWLEEFAHAWEHGHGQGNAESHPDAGEGDGAAGVQHDQQAAE